MVRLGIDFGSSGTVIAYFDPVASIMDDMPLFSPNLIHRTADGEMVIGDGVVTKGLLNSDATARHLRHYILRNSPSLIGAGASAASYQKAGKEYLISLIGAAMSRRDNSVQDAVFTVPQDAPDHYFSWIASVAEDADLTLYHTIDEITAAGIGYGMPLQAGRTILLIDFGADTLDISVGNPVEEAGKSLNGIRIIGRASANEGGRTIDGWLADEYLPEIRNGGGAGTSRENILEIFRQAKESLSFMEETLITFPHGMSGAICRKEVIITRQDLEKILDRHNLYTSITRTIEKALSAAQSRGFDDNDIAGVLMIGGSNLIPSVQELIRQRFGPQRVRCDLPRLAVALGAARYSPAEYEPQRIIRDYALRYWDPAAGEHRYRYIIRKGTVYPTARVISRLLITASYTGQTYLGLALYALGDPDRTAENPEIELVSDPHGSLRQHEQPEQNCGPAPEWINEKTSTLLVATPPAIQGEVRFELGFRIDGGGYLKLSARDVKTGLFVLEDHSMGHLV